MNNTLALVLCTGLLLQSNTTEAKKNKSDAAATGLVKVSAMPLGSAVHVDGEYRCTTPCTLELPTGSHTFKISMTGFVDAYETLDLQPDIVEKLSVNLAKSGKGKIKSLPTTHVQSVAQKGHLTVKSDPAGLAVHINGNEVDDETPCTVEIEQGKYYVMVTNKGVPTEKVIDVTPGFTTVVTFTIKDFSSSGEDGQVPLLTAKKDMLEEMLATGFTKVVISPEQEGEFTLLVDGSETGIEPGPAGKIDLVMPSGQTVILAFEKEHHKGLTKSLKLVRDHEYRLHLDFPVDYASRIEALLAQRPSIEDEPLPPVYEPSSFSQQNNSMQCLIGGVLLSVGLTSWVVAPIMIAGGVDPTNTPLMIGGGVFSALGLVFNIWGVINLVKGCKKIEKIDEEADARNTEKKLEFEKKMAQVDEAIAIDEEIEQLEKQKATGKVAGSITVEDMGESKNPLLSPEAEELSKEIYGEFLVGD